jgi:D-alanyl-D-alanine carboxypeptidase (penicillin-binding protein 5/6)
MSCGTPAPDRPWRAGKASHATASITLLVSLSVLLIAALFTAPGVSSASRAQRKAQPTDQQPSPAPLTCPNRALPPAPIDTSEQPPPGSPSPEPLPVPSEPVGGARMGECGLIHPAEAAPPANITAASWMLADLDTGEVLAAKDPHARERPASLIKVLLAIVAMRDLAGDTLVVGTQEDANQEGTKLGIGPGGQYTVRQLLFGLIMHSGNDSANALARALGGVPAALDKMNAMARELGALDTRAASPSGLDGPGMTTSAYDQSLIFRAAMKHQDFVEAIGTRQVEFPGYGTKPGFKVNNDNRLLGRYPGFIGGKTGFTDDSRHTYLGAAQQGNRRLMVVLLRGERNPDSLPDQGARLLNHGFTLAAQGSEPVGQLVDGVPPVQSNGAQSRRNDPVAAPDLASTQPGGVQQRSAFGNVGLPLVALAGVVMLIAVALWLRRRRVRALAAARAARMR